MVDNLFPFVVYTASKARHDPATKTLIRKQAMKEVGIARRKTKVQLCVSRDEPNHMQSPQGWPAGDETLDLISFNTPSLLNSDDSSSVEHSDSTPSTSLSGTTLVFSPRFREHCESPSRILTSEYESTRALFQFDITDLSALTNFGIGESTLSILSASPCRLASILGKERWSYLHFVPSYYGFSDCVRAATDCVLSRMQDVLVNQKTRLRNTLRLYTKALSSLQQAISDKDACDRPDILCAIQLLSVYELLDPTRAAEWRAHVHGAKHLIEGRSCKSFPTEFDQALLSSHVGAMIVDCIHENKHCYLDTPEWLELYTSLTRETEHLTDRSSLVIKIRSTMFAVPGLWYDIGEHINGPGLFDDETMYALELRARKCDAAYTTWLTEYSAYCLRRSLSIPTHHELEIRREVYGLALECSLLVKRLLATVCDRDRNKLEKEVQVLASIILGLEESKSSWLFSDQEVGVAQVAMTTRDQWENSEPYNSQYDTRMATRSRYNPWNEALRQSAHTEEDPSCPVDLTCRQ